MAAPAHTGASRLWKRYLLNNPLFIFYIFCNFRSKALRA